MEMEGSVTFVSLCFFFAHICSKPCLRLIADRVPRQTETTSLLVVMIIGLNAGAFSGWKWESTAFVPGQISLFGRKDSPLKKAS